MLGEMPSVIMSLKRMNAMETDASDEALSSGSSPVRPFAALVNHVLLHF